MSPLSWTVLRFAAEINRNRTKRRVFCVDGELSKAWFTLDASCAARALSQVDRRRSTIDCAGLGQIQGLITGGLGVRPLGSVNPSKPLCLRPPPTNVFCTGGGGSGPSLPRTRRSAATEATRDAPSVNVPCISFLLRFIFVPLSCTNVCATRVCDLTSRY